MRKKESLFLWSMLVILGVFASACTNPIFFLTNTPTCEIRDASIKGNPTAAVGQEVRLQAEPAMSGVTYTWSGEFEGFQDSQSSLLSFVVPEGVEAIDVSVEIAKDEDEACRDSADFELAIIAPTTIVQLPENVDEQTATPEATSTPTIEPSLTPTVSPIPATPTSTETAVPTATPSPTNPPLPTVTATPPYNSPVITELRFLPGGAVYISWTWDGELSPTQNFAVRFWSESDPRPEARFSITWTKGFSHQFGVTNIEYPEGTYLVNVAVMEGPSDGYHYAVAESDNVAVFVNNVPPTEEPMSP